LIYAAYEMTHAVVSPWRSASLAMRHFFSSPINPIAYLPAARAVSAVCDLFERATRRYGKPDWDIDSTVIGGRKVPVEIEVVRTHPFCDLLHFRREHTASHEVSGSDPAVLIVAPLSGHHATLLRGTVEAMLPEHDVYVTDWLNARDVPLAAGSFGLADYIDYLIDFYRLLGPDLHVMAVCQPGPAVLAAASLLAAADDPAQPASMVLMGSPIDSRLSPTVPNKLATSKSLDWFERNVITAVPWPNPGMFRQVYPGFFQLTGFMTMNMDRHVNAHLQLFRNLIEGDGESAEAHRAFYDEYLSVLDMTAEFYLDTIRVIFQEHDLPDGRMLHRGEPVRPQAITRTALMTVEGARDDISGVGQTQAAHRLCTNIPAEMRECLVHPTVGHYGIFNGRRWRDEIQPQVRDFIRANRGQRATAWRKSA
jgi:poly(3-hydroxybutyrate) depolymerase